MKWVKIISSIIFSIIIIIAIGGYFAIRNFDLNKYKPYISEIVKNQINRELVIRGNASVGISLVPTVIIDDVALSNPGWARTPEMIAVKQVEVKFALLPLLKKQIVIDKVNLIEPVINLEKAKNGENNWTFSAQAPQQISQVLKDAPQADKIENVDAASQPGAALLAGFAARNILIEKGVVSYYDGAAKKETKIVINKVTLNEPAVDENMEASFDVTADGQKVKGKMTLGSLKTLIENKEAFPVDLTAQIMGINIQLTGSVADITEAPRYAFQTNIYNPAGNLKAPETTLKARIDGDVNKADADIQTLNIVNNLITGKATVKWSGKVPDVKVNLKSNKINLQNFSQSSNFAFELPSIISQAQASQLVPDTAVPYSVLKSVNATANLDIKQLIINPGLQADDVKVAATLQGGVLKVNPLNLKFGGGNINADMQVNANNQTAQLKLNSNNMLLQNLHKEFAVTGKNDFGVLSGGNVDLDINLTSSGATYRKLVDNLNGKAIVIVDKSVIQTGGLSFMTGNFISQLLSALRIDTKKEQKLDLVCGVIRADFANGKANFPKGIAVNSKQLNLVSDGNINLVNDKLDFSIKPFSGKIVDTNVVQALSSLIKVKGTLSSPKIALDDKETLKTIVGVATTGGAAFLGSKLALDADSSPCYTALKGTAYENRFPKPTGVQATTQSVYQGASETVDKNIKVLQNTAKGFLKAITGNNKQTK